MGQFKITENLGGGKYRGQYLQDVQLAKGLLQEFEAKKPEIEQSILDKQAEIADKQTEIDAIVFPIEDDFEDKIEYLKAIDSLIIEKRKLIDERTVLEKDLAFLEIQLISVEKQINLLNDAINEKNDITIYCVDYKIDLEIDEIVPTLELNDEFNELNEYPLIYPYRFRARQNDIDFIQSVIDEFQLHIDYLNDWITALNDRLQELEQEQIDKQTEVTNQTNFLATIPRDNDAKIEEETAKLNELIQQLNDIINEINTKIYSSEVLLRQRKDIQNHIDNLTNEKTAFTTSANLTPPRNIYNQSTEVVPVIDSSVMLSNPAASCLDYTYLWNLICLSAWQKWRPEYRRGKITAIDYETGLCNVRLDYEIKDVSSIPITGDDAIHDNGGSEQIAINEKDFFENVLIQYGHQYGFYTFKVDDLVVLNFRQSTTKPAVIGWQKEPKQTKDFLVADVDINIDLDYWFEIPGWPGLNELYTWTVFFNVLDENKTLFDIFKNCNEYDYHVNSNPPVKLNPFSEYQIYADVWDDPTLRIRVQINYFWFETEDTDFSSNTHFQKPPYLSINVFRTPLGLPIPAPEFFDLKITDKNNETILDIHCQLEHYRLLEAKSVVVTDNLKGAGLLAPVVGFEGEFFSLVYPE